MAIKTVSLAEATALMYLSPVLVTLFAGVFLGERILPRHLLAVAAGFVGVLVIIRPGFQTFEPALLLAFFASLLLALYFLLTRKVAGVDDPRTSLFYTSIVGAVVLSFLVPLWWKTPDALQWLLLISMGAFGAIGHFLLIKAYTLITASELSPWLNAQVVAATLFSVFLFQDVLGWNFFVGSGLIVGAGLLLWLHNRRVS
jgi:drug/metabolite transporter (DMT)-like permease